MQAFFLLLRKASAKANDFFAHKKWNKTQKEMLKKINILNIIFFFFK